MWGTKKKDIACSKCKRVLSLNEKRVVCCRKENPTCESCSKHPCVWCGGSYQRALEENVCSLCQRTVPPDATFTNEANKIICSLCVAIPYRWHYRLFINKGTPLQVPITAKSVYSFQQMKVFFKGYCIDCGRKPLTGYKLKEKVLVCDACYLRKEFYEKVTLLCEECLEPKRKGEKHLSCISNTFRDPKESQIRFPSYQPLINEIAFLTSSNAENIVSRIPLKLESASEVEGECSKCKSLLRKNMSYGVNNIRQSLNETILKKMSQKSFCKLCYVSEIQMMKKQFTRELFPWTPNGSDFSAIKIEETVKSSTQFK